MNLQKIFELNKLQTTKYEHIIFYLDVTGSHVKRKDVTKAVILFIKEKSNLNPLTKYGLLYFKTGGYPEYVDEDDSNVLVKKITEDWKDKESTENFLENGLFYCLSEITRISTERAGEFRVIVITDKPSNKPEEYQEALFNLVNTVCFFPTYIDIIRVGMERFYSDDVKLRIVTSTTNGGLFYVNESKHLSQILVQGLTKSKRFSALNQPEKIVIDEDNKEFYEKLATDLLTPSPNEESGLCAFCNSKNCESGIYTRILKCYNCNTHFHEYHIGKYAFENNIGLLHIFRCPRCEVLLRMDEHAACVINDIPIEQEPGESMFGSHDEYASDIEMDVNTDSISDQDYYSEEELHKLENEEISDKHMIAPPNGNDQVIPLRPSGFSFFQQPVLQSNTRKSLQSPPSSESYQTQNKESEPEKNMIKSPTRRSTSARKFLVCKICGTSNNVYDKKCSNCNVDLR